MMKRGTTMITDIVVRYADNISVGNEIANFRRLSINGENISAVSWELPGVPRRKAGECLLKNIVTVLRPPHSLGELYVRVELSSEQPDNAIVNYKKTWGLLKSFGVHIDDIENKSNFTTKSQNGLILSATGVIDLQSKGIIESLINCEVKAYFSLCDSKSICDDLLSNNSQDEWMNLMWKHNGIVFILLGHFDEKDCEIVALGHEPQLKPLRHYVKC